MGWTISNEKFMEGLTWLNNLKLRAGYGVTGVIVGDSYNSLTRYEDFYHHLRMEMDEYRRLKRNLRVLKSYTDYEEDLYEEAV